MWGPQRMHTFYRPCPLPPAHRTPDPPSAPRSPERQGWQNCTITAFITFVFFQMSKNFTNQDTFSLKEQVILFSFIDSYNLSQEVKNPSVVQEMQVQSLIPGSGRSPGEGTDNPLQDSCLENPLDRGAWWATFHGVERVRYDLRD